ncbi:MAG: hypothetical protein J6R04_01780 [Clostridia bacterium]|nr:hypothetical protein [Clostridia bacterium]
MRNRTYRPRRPWRERLYSFMIGRNGGDALSRALLLLYIALSVVNVFVTSWIVYAVACAVAAYALFRIFSRNLYARRRENAWYLRIENGIKGFFRLQRNQWRDRKTHVYRRCKACKSVLRLPREKGTHTVRCPRCQHRFEVNI